eukprot:1159010-Pelagomonas_calceolata.AAC.13
MKRYKGGEAASAGSCREGSGLTCSSLFGDEAHAQSNPDAEQGGRSYWTSLALEQPASEQLGPLSGGIQPALVVQSPASAQINALTAETAMGGHGK